MSNMKEILNALPDNQKEALTRSQIGAILGDLDTSNYGRQLSKLKRDGKVAFHEKKYKEERYWWRL